LKRDIDGIMFSLLQRLIEPNQRTRALWLVALMIGSALTESLGVMLLVPLLAALEPGANGAVGTWLAQFGLDLGQALVLFVGLVALRALINLARGSQTLQLEIDVVDQLRQRAWRALLAADWRVLSAMRRAESISVLVTAIDRAGYGVNQAIAGLAALITLGGLALAGLAVAPAITLGGALGGVLVLLAYGRLRRRAAQLGDRLGIAYTAMQGGLNDNLEAMRMVKSLGGEARAEAAVLTGFAELSGARLAYQRDIGLGQLALQAGGAAVLAVLVWLAVERWQLGTAAILPMVALFARSLPLLGALQESWQHFSHARPAIEAAFALIDAAEAAREPDPGQSQPIRLEREIRLEQAGVQFDGSPHPALCGIDLVIPALGIAALTGASGAGKSTLADLLGGLISPDSGRLTVDGTPVDPGNRRAWRRKVAYVHQRPVMLAASLRENLTWGRAGFNDSALQAALRLAAADFALDLPLGLDTPLGDGGRVLSGGEQQRIALARALLGKPDLLILDEATSALDPASEAQVAEAIAGLKGKMTMLVIAHRGLLTELADRTYRLKQGCLVS
jgi:ATP-binding cassette subfamily C protein